MLPRNRTWPLMLGFVLAFGVAAGVAVWVAKLLQFPTTYTLARLPVAVLSGLLYFGVPLAIVVVPIASVLLRHVATPRIVLGYIPVIFVLAAVVMIPGLPAAIRGPFGYHPVVAVVLIVTAFVLRSRPNGQRIGHCSRCDYDLTGNESGVCPECGTPTPDVPADAEEFSYEDFVRLDGRDLWRYMELRLNPDLPAIPPEVVRRVLSGLEKYDEYHLVYALELGSLFLPGETEALLPRYLAHPEISVHCAASRALERLPSIAPSTLESARHHLTSANPAFARSVLLSLEKRIAP
jgi:hypothetical protein